MHNDVLHALDRLFGELEVEPNTGGGGTATTPFNLHLLDAPGSYLNSKNWLPALEQRRDNQLQLLPVPAQQDGFPLLGAGSRADRQIDARHAAQRDFDGAVMLVHPQSITPAQEIVTLAVDHLAP